MTLIFPSMEPDVSFSPTDLTQKESMGADTSIAADAEARSLYVDRYPRDGVLSLRHAPTQLPIANAKATRAATPSSFIPSAQGKELTAAGEATSLSLHSRET